MFYVFQTDRLIEGEHGKASYAEICVMEGAVEATKKFPPAMAYVSLVCTALSIICLLLHLLATALVPELRNLPGKTMASLSLALVVAYVAFLTGQLPSAGSTACRVIAAVTYFSFLAAFFWMGCMAFDVWHTLSLAATKLQSLSKGKKAIKFLAYSAVSWLCPAACVALALILDSSIVPGIPLDYQPRFGQSSCWFSNRKALLVFFAFPLCFIMTMNAVLFVLSARIVSQTTRTSRTLQARSDHQATIVLLMRINVKLALIMGLTWFAGIFAGWLDRSLKGESLIFQLLWYTFIVLNSLQVNTEYI